VLELVPSDLRCRRTQVIRRANDSYYGLAGAIFTKDLDTAITVSHALRAGACVRALGRLARMRISVLPPPTSPHRAMLADRIL
jgi:hypothetical protein